MQAETFPVLRCLDLTVRYSGRPAIDGVRLDVASAETVAVLGASGSGKTTLLRAIAGLVPPSSGEIWLAGRRIATPASSLAPERRNIGMVFQDFALWPHLTVLDTVAYPLRRAHQGRLSARRSAQALLDQLDLAALADRKPAELSGGQQQRAGLARALARSPAMFLLDEPTAHLDTHLRASFIRCVREQQTATGAAAVYATHDAAEALAIANRVALLVEGRLVQLDEPEVVYARPVSIAAAALTGPCSVLPAHSIQSAAGGLVVDFGDGPTVIPGCGPAASGPNALLLRPEWVRLGGPFTGHVAVREFRGGFTDYRVSARMGQVQLRLAGAPRLAEGQRVEWGIEQAWVVPHPGSGASLGVTELSPTP